MDKCVKIGIFGANRAKFLIGIINGITNCKLTAVCNRAGDSLKALESTLSRRNILDQITIVNDFDDLLKADVDLIIVANCAHQHAPYAIKALKAGKHVLSEILSFSTLKEAVELIEAVESSGSKYALLDQTCFKDTLDYFRTIVNPEDIVEVECEDSYNVTSQRIKDARRANSNYWRNHLASTTYTTHVLGSAINFLKKNPVNVSAIEWGHCPEQEADGRLAPPASTITLQFDDNTVIKHHRITGTLAPEKRVSRIMFTHRDGTRYSVDDTDVIKYDGDTETVLYTRTSLVVPSFEAQRRCISAFVDHIVGVENSDISLLHDIYEASNITMAGLLAFKSIIQSSSEVRMPDLHNKLTRDEYRNDTFCTFPDVGGDMYVPADYMRKKEAKD